MGDGQVFLGQLESQIGRGGCYIRQTFGNFLFVAVIKRVENPFKKLVERGDFFGPILVCSRNKEFRYVVHELVALRRGAVLCKFNQSVEHRQVVPEFF